MALEREGCEMIIAITACCQAAAMKSFFDQYPYCQKCLQDDPPLELIEVCEYCRKPERVCDCHES